MPITEVPQPPSTDPETSPRDRGSRRRGGPYDDLEPYDLLHVIEDLKDDRSRAQLREKIWIALIFHLLLFGYIVLAPKYIYHVKVRDNTAMDKHKPMFLELPPDALKQLKPTKAAPQSDKDRQAQSQHPTPDQKTLAELEAMRRAGRPVPKPAPKPAPQQNNTPAPTPPAQPPQQAAAPPQPKATPEPKPSETAKTETPTPKPSVPNFQSSPMTAAQQMQDAERAARSGGGGEYGGDGGANAPVQHPGNQGAVDVLSDTMGVDFGPYISRVVYETKRAWYPIIPGIAEPPINKQGVTVIRFKIRPDGSVIDMHLDGPAGTTSLDRAAWGGITGASPYPPLPKNFKGPYLELRFYFLYNKTPGVR